MRFLKGSSLQAPTGPLCYQSQRLQGLLLPVICKAHAEGDRIVGLFYLVVTFFVRKCARCAEDL